MDITFEIIDPDPEHHPNHFVIVAVLESGERIEVIGFKNRRDAVIIADTLRKIYRNCKKCPKQKKLKVLEAATERGEPIGALRSGSRAPGLNHTA